jgi:hypothetical protein
MTWNANEYGTAIWDENGKRIATVTSGNKADALVMAASRELLAALKKLLSVEHAEATLGQRLDDRAAAHAAIAKAEGGGS